jgi:hypothetical protein
VFERRPLACHDQHGLGLELHDANEHPQQEIDVLFVRDATDVNQRRPI